MLRIGFYKPAERLQPYISAYYFIDVDSGDPVQDLLHPEWANIRFVPTGYWTAHNGEQEANSTNTPATIYGPTSRTTTIVATPPTRMVAVGLPPLGWAHLIERPADKFSDRIGPLKEAFADDTDRLWQALHDAADDSASRAVFDDFFLALHAGRAEPAPLLKRAHTLLLDSAVTTAEEFAASLDRSSRQVARLSLDMFGFPPKLLLRRERFLRTLAMLRSRLDESWVSLIDAAYYDQSHFVRDFQRFMGMSPTQYFALPHIILDPAARLRQSAIGETLQSLHPVARGCKVEAPV